jgi:hypothetical protein
MRAEAANLNYYFVVMSRKELDSIPNISVF